MRVREGRFEGPAGPWFGTLPDPGLAPAGPWFGTLQDPVREGRFEGPGVGPSDPGSGPGPDPGYGGSDTPDPGSGPGPDPGLRGSDPRPGVWTRSGPRVWRGLTPPDPGLTRVRPRQTRVRHPRPGSGPGSGGGVGVSRRGVRSGRSDTPSGSNWTPQLGTFFDQKLTNVTVRAF